MGYWPVVNDMMRDADIIVLVGDARMPELSLNRELMNKIERFNKAYVVAFNKADLISNDKIKELRELFKGAFFVSGRKNEGIGELKKALLIIAKKMKIENPKIGIVGYPNVGKSAVINALAHRARAKIENKPGTTKGIQWVKVGSLRVLDSPGVIPYEDKNKELALLGSKSVEKMKNPEYIACEIIKMFLHKDREKLKEYYKLESVEGDEYEILLAIGKRRGYLKKKGEIDENRTSATIIREWQNGYLGFK
ncbi:MAG: GTPase [Nanoarchaeota archaeon]